MSNTTKIIRRVGIVLVAGGVAHLAIAVAAGAVTAVTTIAVAAAGVIATGLVLARRRLPRTAWWSSRLCAGIVGVELLASVGDRFGLLGEPGAEGVSWGVWEPFVAYTGTLLPWLPDATVPAIGATVAESALGILLIVGIFPRIIGLTTGVMFTVFAAAMATTVGWGEVGRFAMLIHIGAIAVAAVRGPRPTTREARAAQKRSAKLRRIRNGSLTEDASTFAATTS